MILAVAHAIAYRMVKKTTTTEILRELASSSEGNITLEHLLASLGERSFGLAMLVLALPNTVPLIPGFASLCAVPMFIIAYQMVAGKSCIRLPRRFNQLKLPRVKLSKLLLRCIPFIERMEQVIKPRFAPLSNIVAEKMIGLLWAMLAAIIFLPIPFGDPVPSFCASLLALGMLEKDGLVIVCGVIVSLATIYGMWVLIMTLLAYVWQWIANLL